MSVERQFLINGKAKRPDLICFDNQANVLLLAEFKAPSVRLSMTVFEQSLVYNQHLSASLILLSNGIEAICASINKTNGQVEYLNHIPTKESVI